MASSNPNIPYVHDGRLYRHDGQLICAVASSLADKTGWYDWLQDERHKSFAFVAGAGAHCTVVKERRRSTLKTHYYWFAYRSIGGEKRRVSLGKSDQVNLTTLSQAAAKLAQLELQLEAPADEPTQEPKKSSFIGRLTQAASKALVGSWILCWASFL